MTVDARSNVGPITFGATGVTGTVTVARLPDGLVDAESVDARLEFEIGRLTSGNALYDAELHRRIDVRRFPRASVALRHAWPLGGSRYGVAGDISLHGVTRRLEGAVTATLDDTGLLTVAGEQVIDIREFDVSSPSVLMLRIFPDVRVRLHLEAEPPV